MSVVVDLEYDLGLQIRKQWVIGWEELINIFQNTGLEESLITTDKRHDLLSEILNKWIHWILWTEQSDSDSKLCLWRNSRF